MVDLMVALDLSVIVAARTALGTINHTLLTLEALRRRTVRVVGVVMVGDPDANNKAAIKTFMALSPIEFERPGYSAGIARGALDSPRPARDVCRMRGWVRVQSGNWLTGGVHFVIVAVAAQAHSAVVWPYALASTILEALYVAGKRAEVITLSATHMVPDPKLNLAREQVQIDFFRQHLGPP